MYLFEELYVFLYQKLFVAVFFGRRLVFHLLTDSFTEQFPFYKVTVFARSGKARKLRPETYLLVEENGNLFINTGYRIDIAYNEAADVLTFSPNGDYVRKEVRP